MVRITSSPGDARALARRAAAQGVETIVAAGGDGTINEVVNGMNGSRSRLGILPVGTMNVFAAELGIPMDNLEAAWSVIEAGHVRSLDLPTVNGDCFVQLAGAGLDAQVVRQTTTDSKNILGPLSYLLTLAQVALEEPPHLVVETADATPHEGRFVLVGNGRYYGGPFVVFKEARLDDGMLDVLIFKKQSHWDLVRYFQAIAFGQHYDLPDVEYFQTSSLTIRSTANVPIEVDGELSGSLPARFAFSSEKLLVLAPESGQ